jgi:hypothetical protein
VKEAATNNSPTIQHLQSQISVVELHTNAIQTQIPTTQSKQDEPKSITPPEHHKIIEKIQIIETVLSPIDTIEIAIDCYS